MPKDPFIREKFSRVHTAARTLAKEYFERYPKDDIKPRWESWHAIGRKKQQAFSLCC
jgi:hypothetical protein